MVFELNTFNCTVHYVKCVQCSPGSFANSCMYIFKIRNQLIIHTLCHLKMLINDIENTWNSNSILKDCTKNIRIISLSTICLYIKKIKNKCPFTLLFTFEMLIEQNDVMCSTMYMYNIYSNEGNRLSLWSLKMDTLHQAIAQVV